MSTELYGAKDLRRFCREVFLGLGVPRRDAHVVADALVRANLEGTDSHGVNRLPIYARRMREGRISAAPEIRLERVGCVLRADGGNGLGQVASYRALEAALPVVKESGIAAVTVRNSNHFGTAAYYCQMACREDLALMATTNSPPGIAPWGGKEPYFGTNPIAFGFPTRREPPVIVDMSSSVVARGRIILAAAQGQDIPKGWATDENGADTMDASAALRGAVLPLGGAKGYALALAVEVLSGVLSGAAFGPQVNNLYKDDDPPANVGHCFFLLDVSRWMPLEDYHARMDQFLGEIKAAPRAEGYGEIFYPGERRYQSRLRKTKEGVALPTVVEEELRTLGLQYGVTFPPSVSKA